MSYYISGIINNANVIQNPQAVHADIAMQNLVNEQYYNLKSRCKTAKLTHRVMDAFPNSRVYRTFRKRFTAIKVEHPTEQDLNTVRAIDLFLEGHREGYSVYRTAKGIIFRVHRPEAYVNGVPSKSLPVKRLFGLE